MEDEVIFKRIRVSKANSAFLYTVLESNEGIAGYTTLPHQNGDLYRDLELQIPRSQLEECERVLKQLGDLIYDIK